MSSFTGVSIVEGHEGCSCNTSAVDTGTDNDYHLFLVKGYSRTKELISTSKSINAGPFKIGGHDWLIEYYPNGENPNRVDFISLYVSLFHDDNKVDARVNFTLVDQVERQTSMYIRATNKACRFDNNVSWGTDKFLARDALERSAHLKGDSFTIQCDIPKMPVATTSRCSCLT
ncbi:hypothetical protein VPH35_114179 [Triticum aestivum]